LTSAAIATMMLPSRLTARYARLYLTNWLNRFHLHITHNPVLFVTLLGN